MNEEIRQDLGNTDAPIDLAKALEEAEAMMDGPEKEARVSEVKAQIEEAESKGE